MLLNIDKPLRTSTLHEETCSYIPVPYGTEFKAMEKLGHDGGWFFVSSITEAKVVAHREFPKGTFKSCHYCQKT